MSTNQKTWVFIAILVLVTLSVSLGTMSSHSQQNSPGKPVTNPTPDFGKYPVADLSAPEPSSLAERAERSLKNKRYDRHAMVLQNPGPDDTLVVISDAEPEPAAIPSETSRLVIIGSILSSNAFVSNDKSGVYSEYSLYIQSVLKNDKAKERHPGETIIVDRSGGYVKYPKGQKILYINDWQDLPELNGRYLIFLDKEGSEQNPNYKIITAYQFKDNQVLPLDRTSRFAEFKGMAESTFVKRVGTSSK
jgi:hypothetical protein